MYVRLHNRINTNTGTGVHTFIIGHVHALACNFIFYQHVLHFLAIRSRLLRSVDSDYWSDHPRCFVVVILENFVCEFKTFMDDRCKLKPKKYSIVLSSFFVQPLEFVHVQRTPSVPFQVPKKYQFSKLVVPLQVEKNMKFQVQF